MTNMVVYWVDADGVAQYEAFPSAQDQLSKVLAKCASLRINGMRFVTTTGDSNDMGGIVKDGKLPNGEPYTWKKRR